LVCGGLIKIQTPTPVQGRFLYRLEPCPLPPGPGGLETVKAEEHIFKMLSGCKLTRAAPGTSASYVIKVS